MIEIEPMTAEQAEVMFGMDDREISPEEQARQDAEEAHWRAKELAESEFMKRSCALQAAIQIAGAAGGGDSADDIVKDAQTILAFLTGESAAPASH